MSGVFTDFTPYFMKKFGLLLIMLMTSHFLYCQTDTTKKDEPDNLGFDPFVESMPEFIGGNESLRKYINTNTLITKQAIKDKVEGTVYVSFWIESDGRVSNTRILRGIRHDLDSVSLSIINNMPKWIPATLNGKPLRMRFTLPFKFKLDGRTPFEEPIASAYWKKRGKIKFEKTCKETYNKSQEECDCWYKFIIWNYNSLHIEMIDLKVMFEKYNCDTR